MEEVDYGDVEMSQPPIVPNKLNIYGVSRLSTKDIVSFLHSLFPSDSPVPEIKIEWIDDSSCNAVFSDEEFVSLLISSGTPVESGEPGCVLYTCPATSEGDEPHPLNVRQATENDVKNPKRSWKESKYYRKRLEEKGINPETLRPVSKVILKPRQGVPEPKVSLIPRRLVHQAKSAIYGDDAFSKIKERKAKRSESHMVVDEEEIRRREDRSKRFAAHR